MGIIKKVKQVFETQTTLLMKKAGTFKEEDIECSIDEQEVECSKLEAPIPEQSSYVGVPAPILNPVDDWFSSPYGFFYFAITERQKDYMERETEMKRQEQEKNSSVEPEDIHQKMYEIATQNNSINIDHGWQSGTGRF